MISFEAHDSISILTYTYVLYRTLNISLMTVSCRPVANISLNFKYKLFSQNPIFNVIENILSFEHIFQIELGFKLFKSYVSHKSTHQQYQNDEFLSHSMVKII